MKLSSPLIIEDIIYYSLTKSKAQNSINKLLITSVDWKIIKHTETYATQIN